MLVGNRQNLGIEAREDSGENVGREALEVLDASACERARDAVSQRLRVFVARPAQPEADIGERVGHESAPAEQAGPECGTTELEGRGALHQRAIEIKENRRGPVARLAGDVSA